MTNKVWFITGVSSGFGRIMVDQLVARGDTVVGTLRSDTQIAEFSKQYDGKATFVKMDVTDEAAVKAGVEATIQKYGRIDVLVNNAGYGYVGAVEETSLDEYRTQLETNVFGAISVTKAVLPHMRAAKTGCIVQLSSVAGVVSNPGFSAYNASKYALEGFSESLNLEVAPLGIKVMLVEPGPYRTKFAGSSLKRAAATPIPDYADTAHALIGWVESIDGTQQGDPEKAIRVMIKAIESANTPLRLPLGGPAIDRIRAKMAAFEAEIKEWEKESRDTDCDDVKAA